MSTPGMRQSQQNAQIDAQAGVAKQNAQISSANAAQAAKATQDNLRISRRNFNVAAGSARAQYGLLGIFGGSSLDVLADMSNEAAFEQAGVVRSGVTQQVSYLNQSNQYRAQAANLLQTKKSPWLAEYVGNVKMSAQVAAGALSGNPGMIANGIFGYLGGP